MAENRGDQRNASREKDRDKMGDVLNPMKDMRAQLSVAAVILALAVVFMGPVSARLNQNDDRLIKDHFNNNAASAYVTKSDLQEQLAPLKTQMAIQADDLRSLRAEQADDLRSLKSAQADDLRSIKTEIDELRETLQERLPKQAPAGQPQP